MRKIAYITISISLKYQSITTPVLVFPHNILWYALIIETILVSTIKNTIIGQCATTNLNITPRFICVV